MLGGANFSHVYDGSMLSTQRNKSSNFTFSDFFEEKTPMFCAKTKQELI